ncbi:hypothetical protein [Paludisphaera sp.]|uniref:hypothetical protein n=1 Tax=Paludisphaera sp. TaxID=2017432 RepID=UPI00301BBE3F
MGRIGYTYGSEWHLQRMLAYHRDDLNRHVEAAVPGSRVLRWLPQAYTATDPGSPDPGCYPTAPRPPGRPPAPRKLDEELKGIDFLTPYLLAKVGRAWLDYWPRSGNMPNWDAAGQIDVGGTTHWLLVEAKAHVGELRSECKASERGGLGAILAAFERTARTMDVEVDVASWLTPFYQFCNRLAVLNFLLAHEIPAVVLFAYFLGDRFPEGDPAICPATRAEWEPHLGTMYAHVGWTAAAANPLRHLVRRSFIPVWRPTSL